MIASTRALALLLVAAGCIVGGAAQAEPDIGSVLLRAYWGAVGTRVAGDREPLYFNTMVYADEMIETGADGSTALRFHDGTKLQVGASSSLVLDRFVYDPGTGAADAAISFSKGIFRFISGKLRDDGIRLATPSATLVIRGTRFVLSVGDGGNTNVWVIDGAVEGTSRAGGAAGTARAGQSLEVTSGVPGVRVVSLRTGPHDPAVEADLGLLGQPGRDDHDGATGHGSSHNNGDSQRGQ